MRQQQQLVLGMKADQIAHGPPRREQPAQPPVGKHPLDEVVAEARIGEPALFLDGQVRIRVDECCSEHSAAAAIRRAVTVVDLHPLQPTARRVLLEDEAREIFIAQRRGARSREPFHPRR
jgi:hypothetical protein